MFRNIKVLLAVVVVLALAGGAFAFAAGNTVPKSAAGYTANVVSGYTVTNIVYDLNKDNPTNVDNISFTIAPSTIDDPVAKTVYLQTALSGPWTLCVVTTDTATTAKCTPAISPVITDVTAMNIVASSSLDPTPAP
jgi:hypothetical protein